MKLAHVVREGRAGELAELPGEVGLIRVPMLRREPRPRDGPVRRLDGAHDALEAREPAERLWAESDVVAELPLELPCAEPVSARERVDARAVMSRQTLRARTPDPPVGEPPRAVQPSARTRCRESRPRCRASAAARRSASAGSKGEADVRRAQARHREPPAARRTETAPHHPGRSECRRVESTPVGAIDMCRVVGPTTRVARLPLGPARPRRGGGTACAEVDDDLDAAVRQNPLRGSTPRARRRAEGPIAPDVSAAAPEPGSARDSPCGDDGVAVDWHCRVVDVGSVTGQRNS